MARSQGADGVQVRIRLFAMQRELAGTREVQVELPADADVAAAWDALVTIHPGLAPGAASVRYARNGAYADAGTRLADGDEVAMIPPVSGGAPSPMPSIRVVELRETAFGPEILGDLIERLATPEDGAAVGFLGRTRVTPGTPAPGQEEEAARHAGRDVEALDYEAHEAMALAVLDEIADEVVARFAVDRLAIVHRTGAVALGATSIAVVAVAAHRGDAFDAARYAIDETKARAPIWKAERFADGHVWIGHPARTGPEEGAS
jgi:molybdopterin synthase catalytic subunit